MNTTSINRKNGYAIATGHTLTSQAAEDVIQSGGNIIDASIAAQYAMMITEPCMASMGGAGMAMLAWEGQTIKTLDFFCQTPNRSHDKLNHIHPTKVDFGDTTEIYYTGQGSIAVPGTMAGIWALHEMGASMPMSVLVEPAIAYCKNGIKLNTFQNFDLNLLKNILIQEEQAKNIYFNEEQIKSEGEVIYNPDLADALDYISSGNSDEFYVGEIAKLFFKDHNEVGQMKPEDWINYSAQWSNPRLIKRKNKLVYYPDRPSLGGLSMEYFWSLYSEDIDILDLPNNWLKAYLKMRDVRLDNSKLLSHFGYDEPTQLSSRGTSHLSIIDNQGNAVSLTSTIGEGAGYFIPQTGIHMNNMLGEEGLMPNGIGSWAENQRLDTMTTPTIITDEHNLPVGAIGSAGATRIPFITAQCIDKILSGMSVEEAIDSPRLHDDIKAIQIEPELKNLRLKNIDSKIWEEQSLYFGGVQAAWNYNDHLDAHGDKRRGGDGRVV